MGELFCFRNCGFYIVKYRRLICFEEAYKTFRYLAKDIFINEIERDIKSHKNCHEDCEHNHFVRVFKYIINQSELKDAEKRSMKCIKTKSDICKILYTGNFCKELVEHGRNFALTTKQYSKNNEVSIVHHDISTAADHHEDEPSNAEYAYSSDDISCFVAKLCFFKIFGKIITPNAKHHRSKEAHCASSEEKKACRVYCISVSDCKPCITTGENYNGSYDSGKLTLHKEDINNRSKNNHCRKIPHWAVIVYKQVCNVGILICKLCKVSARMCKQGFSMSKYARTVNAKDFKHCVLKSHKNVLWILKESRMSNEKSNKSPKNSEAKIRPITCKVAYKVFSDHSSVFSSAYKSCRLFFMHTLHKPITAGVGVECHGHNILEWTEFRHHPEICARCFIGDINSGIAVNS